jgi:DNA-binding NtrC family response regulator
MNTPLQILCIESDLSDFRIVRQYLRDHKLAAKLHRIADLGELKKAMNQGSWDAVLSDYGVPGLEPVERLRRLRPSLKAIISSGYSTGITQDGVLSSADVGYLPKPYQARDLAEAVWNCLHPQQ